MIRPCAIWLAMFVAACGGAQEQPVVSDQDPAVVGALGEQITIDPDLAAQNQAAAAGSLAPQRGSVPTLDVTPEAIGRAREDALKLVGGTGQMRKAPAARPVDSAL